MATTEQAAELLKPYRVEITEEADSFFLAKISGVSAGAVEFKIATASIDDYLSIRPTIHSDQETALFFPGYFEQAIEMGGPGPSSLRLFRRDQPGLMLASADSESTIELSPASETFLLHVGGSEGFRMFRRRMIGMRFAGNRRAPETTQLRDLFARVLTVKAKVSTASPYAANKNRLRELAISGLFNISFSTGVSLNLSRSWERSYYRLARKGDEEPQFPKRLYNKELVGYYQLALSSDSPVLAYLALYKVLEFFFTSASEGVLHKRLADKIAHPDFTHKSAGQLRNVVAMVRKFDQKMDEQRMLVTVLEQYFMADELISWVSEAESSDGVYFTQPQTVFGQPLTLDTNAEKIHPSLAARIYFIRNALVHNKEGEVARFTPFSGQEAALFKEIPLLMFLAEGLIAKNGTDL